MLVLGILGNKNRYRNYFLIITGIGVILSCGTHPPFKHFYLWMVKNVPFFVAFRSPWYKFTLLTCLSYAYFFGFSVGFIYAKLKKVTSRATPILVVILIISLNMIYAFPVTTGKLFTPSHKRSKKIFLELQYFQVLPTLSIFMNRIMLVIFLFFIN